MTNRINFAKTAPKAFKALIGFDAAARAGLDPALVELVQIRASQLNRCAYCLHMHTSDARKAGESEERLHMVAVWHEAGHFFSEKERAALALTEAVTRLSDRSDPVPDAIWDEARGHFDEPALASLVLSIGMINIWNRLNAATRQIAGAWKAAA